MQMPEMDGEETLRAIKADPGLKDVVVIILTSIGIRGDVVRLEALGCAGYLTKPVKQSQLFDTILTVLSREKSQIKDKLIPIVTRHTIEEQKHRRARILLAEDNPMNQKLAVTLLKKAGYSVDAVENGRRAIQSLKLKAYDLILMDVQMSEMDGFEVTKIIRAREGEAKHTPIIAMTAHAMKGDRERCLQAGMDDYISKPIEPQELFGAIEKWTKFRGKEKDLSPSKSELALSEHIEPVEPIDLESALLRFEGDKEFFKEMLREFLSYAPKQLDKLAEAIKTGDAKVVEREAHSLKGAAGNLGAKSIADLALRLEFLGRRGDFAGAKEMIGDLKAELKRLEEYSNRSFKGEIALKS
jgi:two-component system sensor histidine kinase/response regulator